MIRFVIAINTAPDLRCNQCANASFDRVWTCGEAARGICPFQRLNPSQNRYLAGILISLFGSIFILAGLFFPIAMIRQSGATWPSGFFLLVFLTVFLAAGGFIALLGLYLAFGTTRSLCLFQAGAAWQESRILGVLLARRVVQRLANESALPPVKLKFPASIAGLRESPSWQDIKQQIRNVRAMPADEQKQALKAATANPAPRQLVLGVVLDLVSRGVLTASRVRAWTAKFWSAQFKENEEIVLSLGPEFNAAAPPTGALEQQIVRIIANWRTLPASADQPLGPTGKLLVREILGTDRGSPGHTLMEIAATEPLANGLMVRSSRWWPSFKFTENTKPDQEEDHRALTAWIGQHESLDYVKRLSADIQAGIKSRESSD